MPSVVRVLIGYTQHFIGLQGLVDRKKANLRVEVVIAGVKLTGKCFFKILYRAQT